MLWHIMYVFCITYQERIKMQGGDVHPPSLLEHAKNEYKLNVN